MNSIETPFILKTVVLKLEIELVKQQDLISTYYLLLTSNVLVRVYAGKPFILRLDAAKAFLSNGTIRASVLRSRTLLALQAVGRTANLKTPGLKLDAI